MNAPMKRLWTVAAAMLLFVMIGFPAGCDQLETDAARADRRVEAYLADADALRETEAESPSEGRISLLGQAAGESAASPDWLAQARLLLAQAQYDSAQQLMRQIELDELEAARLIWEIDSLARQIALNNTLVEGYQLTEPATARQQIDRSIAEARGGADQLVWFSHEQVQFPTLSAAKQHISQLDGEIANRRQQIEQLQAQRSQLVQQAEQADQQNRDADRDQALAAFRQASDLRKQAADLLIRIETIEAEIVPLEQDRARVQDQQTAVEQAIAALQQRSRDLDQKWAQVQQQIQTQQGLSRSIVEGQGEGPQVTIAAKAEALAAVAARLDENRAAVEQKLQESMGNFQSAGAAAQQSYTRADERWREVSRERSDAQAWEHRKYAGNPNIFTFRQAVAGASLATLHHGSATHLQGRLELSRSVVPILRAANATVPVALEEGETDRRLTEARQRADEAYSSAAEQLDRISEAPLAREVAPVAEMARATRAFVLHGWSQLALQQGQEDQARQRLQAAQSLLRTLRDDPQMRPLVPTTVPPELAVATRPASPAPATPAPAPAAPAPAEEDLADDDLQE